MYGRCEGPIWQSDDFTLCFRYQYLQSIIPLALCALSLLLLFVSLIYAAFHSKYYHAYTLLNSWQNVWDFRDPPPGAGDDDDNVSDATGIDDEIARNAELALHPTVSQANRTTIIEDNKLKGEMLRVCIEALLTAGQVVISILILTHNSRTSSRLSDAEIGAISFLATWSYVALLVLVRLALTASSKVSFPIIWSHTAFLYGFLWIANVLLFRSYILHPPSTILRNLIISSFALNTALLSIALASRIGNKAVTLEYEGDIAPAREPTASLFSLATFTWVDPIVWTGYKKTYELSDVWNLAPYEKAAAILSNYRQVKRTTSLAFHLLSYFKVALLIQGLWAVLAGMLLFVPTLLLKAILEYVEDPEATPRSSAWFFVILLLVSGCVQATADGMGLWLGRKICIRLRAIIIGEIYAKALRRKAGSAAEKVLGEDASKTKDAQKKGFMERLKARFTRKQEDKKTASETAEDSQKAEDPSQVSSGTIINLMAVDSFKVAEVCAYLHFLWGSTPVQFILAIVLLHQILGYSSIAGIGMMIILLPINMYISKKFASIQKKILATTDTRIHTTNEVLTNIRIIKFFAWEQRFMENIEQKRRKELGFIRKRYILWSFAGTVWGGAPIVITLLTFAVYTFVEKKDLIPSVAFTALSLFQILRVPLDQLADMIAHVQESKVSVDRIEEFLTEDDTQKYKQLKHTDIDDTDPVIGFDNATFSWSSASASQDLPSAFRMMDLDMRFAVGQFNVVIGPTGSGKTSLLMALLGEMTKLQGKVYLPGARSKEDITRDPRTGLIESVAYCAQQAWLVNDTVKQNILFASPWDGARYKKVIEVCSLKSDLDILDDGDETLIGEKGVTLSGGQKQRISLARALYSNARHLLLDDVLSAVDAHTAKWIFNKALMGPLMDNRTCILVTHNVSLCLPEARFAVLLDNGRVIESGTPETLIKSGKLGDEMTKSAASSRGPSRPDTPQGSSDRPAASEYAELTNGHAIEGLPTTADKKDDPLAGPAKATATPSANAMREGKAEGGVKLSIMFMYFKAMGGFWFYLAATLTFVLQQAANVSTNVWIRNWANQYVKHDYTSLASSHGSSPLTYVRGISGLSSCTASGSCTWNLPIFSTINSTSSQFTVEGQQPIGFYEKAKVDAAFYLGVYAVLGICYMIITFLREFVLFAGSLNASKKIHTRLITSISHAKFRFFDSTPLGQIMNRFSKDVESLDQEIAPVASGLIYCMASIITIVILISVITPGFLIAGTFISILYFLIGKFYINSSRDLRRIESVQRSPLYQQFGETLTGMVTIRAYGDERRFIRENLNKINTHSRPFIYFWATNRWLAFRVDIAGALVSFFAGVFVMLSVGKIDPGAAGLSMTYAVTFTENVLWFVRLYAHNEQNMNSVERIKEYMDVEQEAPPIIPDNRPPVDWPSKGAVEFKNYSTRYRKDFDLVLRNLTFKIAPCEKVGVVGRTGAGKSSLAMALFRALEAEEGSIEIDGVDIRHIGLQDLRENIVMVPQDPTLFTGTIRSNLDPFNLFTDEEIFTALRRVQLIGASGSGSATPTSAAIPRISISDDSNPNTPNKSNATSDTSETAVGTPSAATADNKNIFLTLSSPIAESGSNLSQGQRQLLCLARALLKSPKVLLMDEATASIDYATDSKIQETIRELKGNTIVTIAHRLKTIVDYDRVVVMDRGRIVEYGEPWTLLRPDSSPESDEIIREDGRRWFREMCETSGDLASLEEEARKSYQAKRLVDDS